MSIYLNVCQIEHLFVSACMRARVCVCMHVRAATSFTLGSLNVGHKALRHFSEMFGPRPPTPQLISPAVLQSAIQKSNPPRLNFQFHFP